MVILVPRLISLKHYVSELSQGTRLGTGNCDVASVRRPSLSLVFYKKKRDRAL